MTPWQGKRIVVVVSACMHLDGTPHLVLNHAEVTHEEAENGIHYYLVEADLLRAGYEEPFVHFAEHEAPAFLHPAVRSFLGLDTQPSEPHFVPVAEDY